MSSTLIINAALVNEGEIFEADVRMEAGRIERIGPALTARGNETIIDAGGRTLLPGMIDDQVHFRDPGLVHKGDMQTESRAAVAGGITSFFDMPNTTPQTLDPERVEEKCVRAQAVSHANYAFWMGASNDNLHAIQRLDPRLTPGVKIFMGASTGNMLVDKPEILDAIFRDSPAIIATHCEDQGLIEAQAAVARAQFGDSVPVQWHPKIRNHAACIKSTRLALELARRHNARLHVLHLSTAEEVLLFAPGPIESKRITCETCVHFLHFDERAYVHLGNRLKCNPAVKGVADREALIQAVLDDRIDVLATDHAPHTLEEKSRRYVDAPAGLPLVQFALQSLLDRYFEGHFSLSQIVDKACHAPARMFGIADRGYLREGYFADLVLVDLARPHTVRSADVLSRVGWSPFEGHTFQSSIAATWVNGVLSYDGERVCGQAGQRLRFLGNRR